MRRSIINLDGCAVNRCLPLARDGCNRCYFRLSVFGILSMYGAFRGFDPSTPESLAHFFYNVNMFFNVLQFWHKLLFIQQLLYNSVMCAYHARYNVL